MAKKSVKKKRSVHVNANKYLVTVVMSVDGPNVDESQIVNKFTKRTNTFVNAFKDAKKVHLKEIRMERI